MEPCVPAAALLAAAILLAGQPLARCQLDQLFSLPVYRLPPEILRSFISFGSTTHFGTKYRCRPEGVLLRVLHPQTVRCVCGPNGVLRYCDSGVFANPYAADLRSIDTARSSQWFNGRPPRTLHISAKIVGGRITTITKHMYMLALEYWGSIICGATIISNMWAVTAAHCLEGLDSRMGLTLRAASTYRERGGRVFQVQRVVNHEYFNAANYANDICLLKVNAPFFAQQPALEPALLPQPDELLETDTMVTLLGWGDTKENGTLSDELREVQVPVVSSEDCRYVYGPIITANMICAGYAKGNYDACQADSGGPMMLNRTLVGIVSFGEGCARENRPGVFTRVSAYRRWITRNTGL